MIDPVINKPQLQGKNQRYIYTVITLLFWLVWIYLWLPLLSLAAWAVGFEFFYQHMIILEGLDGLIDLLGLYLLVIFILGTALLFWASYNLIRFRGKDKRKLQVPIDIRGMAEYHGVDMTQLAAGLKSRRMLVRHYDDGKIEEIFINDGPEHQPEENTVSD